MTNPTLRDKQEGGIQASVPSSPTLEPVTSGAPASLTHPAARSRMDTRTMVSIAMLTGIAYIVMLLSKNMPSVYGFLDFDFKDVIICIGGFTFGPFAAAIVRIPASGCSGSVAVSRPGIIAGSGIVSGSVFVAVSGLSAAGVIPGAVSLLSRAGIGVFGQGDLGFDPGDGVAGRVEYAGPGFSARCREQRRAQGAQ